MSGDGVFNNKGQLVAIHGRGDKYTSGLDDHPIHQIKRSSHQLYPAREAF
jgi:hypothetical protein